MYDEIKLPKYITSVKNLYEIIDNAIHSNCNDVYCKHKKNKNCINIKIGFNNIYINDTLEYTLTKQTQNEIEILTKKVDYLMDIHNNK
jgi:hypothetical protein